ncbi:hypothetical protein C8R42DRAFT_714793 [Lentinula raphanica]|nr:hypothetical protein C8R42DRAFT_714793 [Lentinula raphanica]
MHYRKFRNSIGLLYTLRIRIRIRGRTSSYNANHEDFRGGTNTPYLEGQHATQGNRFFPSNTNQYQVAASGYTGPSAPIGHIGSDRSFEGNRDADVLDAIHPRSRGRSETQLLNYENEPASAYRLSRNPQEQLEDLSPDPTRIQDHYEFNSARNTLATQGTNAPDNPREVEKPGAAQLRRCIEILSAERSSEEQRGGVSIPGLEGLADALIKEDLDRELFKRMKWSDVEDIYRGAGWKRSTFLRLRNICEDWDQSEE